MGLSCAVTDCPSGSYARGLCNKHYMRLRRTGTTDAKPEPRRRNPVVCSVEGCDRRTIAFALCDLHYRRKRRVQRVRVCPECDGFIEADRGSRAVRCSRCSALTRRLRPYALTPRQYLALYEGQRGCCVICGEHREHLDVEHCHRTTQVRGLVCGRCNTAMGFFQDDPALLRRAASYLDGPSDNE